MIPISSAAPARRSLALPHLEILLPALILNAEQISCRERYGMMTSSMYGKTDFSSSGEIEQKTAACAGTAKSGASALAMLHILGILIIP